MPRSVECECVECVESGRVGATASRCQWRAAARAASATAYEQRVIRARRGSGASVALRAAAASAAARKRMVAAAPKAW